MTKTIEIRQDQGISQIYLNRPEKYNALNLEMVTELAMSLVKLAKDDSVRGVLITGSGKAFCAGGDLKWAMEFSENAHASFHVLASQLHLAVIEMRRMKKPVVAAINGPAAGAGFSLALACDFRVMEKSAILKQAYTSNGLCIDGSGTFTLPRLVGLARSLESPRLMSRFPRSGLCNGDWSPRLLKMAHPHRSQLTCWLCCPRNPYIPLAGQKNF